MKAKRDANGKLIVPPRRRVPLGRPLSLVELNALAHVTQADVDAAARLWHDVAETELKTLLGAHAESA